MSYSPPWGKAVPVLWMWEPILGLTQASVKNVPRLPPSVGTLSEIQTRPAGRHKGMTTSFWRAPCAPRLIKGPARSETTLDVVLENHPGELNKTEASGHLGRNDLNAFGSETSPAEGSSSKARDVKTVGSFTLSRGSYLWGNKTRCWKHLNIPYCEVGAFLEESQIQWQKRLLLEEAEKMDIQALYSLAQRCRRPEHSIAMRKIVFKVSQNPL